MLIDRVFVQEKDNPSFRRLYECNTEEAARWLYLQLQGTDKTVQLMDCAGNPYKLQLKVDFGVVPVTEREPVAYATDYAKAMHEKLFMET